MSIAGAVSGVTTRPGAIALTRMPRAPSSSAATWVSMLTPAFARAVRRERGAGLPAVETRHQDDRPAGLEAGRSVLDDEERPGEVHVDDGAELLDGEVGDQPERADPGAVDHDVQAAVLVDDAGEQGRGPTPRR